MWKKIIKKAFEHPIAMTVFIQISIQSFFYSQLPNHIDESRKKNVNGKFSSSRQFQFEFIIYEFDCCVCCNSEKNI